MVIVPDGNAQLGWTTAEVTPATGAAGTALIVVNPAEVLVQVASAVLRMYKV